MTLRAAGVVPPTALLGARLMSTPSLVLLSAAVPLTSVPIKLPRSVLPDAPLASMYTPMLFLAIRLHAPVQAPPGVVPVVPPSVLLGAPSKWTP